MRVHRDTNTATDLALLRLLQLVSPALPIGMFCYSQGLETAVESGWVHDSRSAGSWLGGVLAYSIGRTDAPILVRLLESARVRDFGEFGRWTAELTAYRDTVELRDEDRRVGQSLAKTLLGLGVTDAEPWLADRTTTLAASFALGAVAWEVPLPVAVAGYLWSWLENQVLCAVKLIPLGQSAGQKLLYELAREIPTLTDAALTMCDAELGGNCAAVGIASARHEVQYSRLFRS